MRPDRLITSSPASKASESTRRPHPAYVRAVADAGGLPLLIPLGLLGDTLRGSIDRLDGLLLSGGGDSRRNLWPDDHRRR